MYFIVKHNQHHSSIANQRSEMVSLLQLPAEVIFHIVQYLDKNGLHTCLLVSQQLHDIAFSVCCKAWGTQAPDGLLFWSIEMSRLRTFRFSLQAGANTSTVFAIRSKQKLEILEPQVYLGRRYVDRKHPMFGFSMESHQKSVDGDTDGGLTHIREWDPLLLAAKHGNDTMIQLLLAEGARIDAFSCGLMPGFNFCPQPYFSALGIAIGNKDLSTAKLLLSGGASIWVGAKSASEEDTQKTTALHIACRYGFIKLATILLGEGYHVDINELDGYKRTALFYAYSNKQWNCFKWLLQAGASTNATPYNTSGCTMLHDACSRGRFDEALNLIDFGMVTKGGADVMRQCCSFTARGGIGKEQDQYRADLIKRLIDLGVDIESCCSEGKTSLLYCIAAGSLPSVKALLDAGADVNAYDQDGRTPLIYACIGHLYQSQEVWPSLPMVKCLLDRGAKLSPPEEHGGQSAMWFLFKSCPPWVPDKVSIAEKLLPLMHDIIDDTELPPELVQFCIRHGEGKLLDLVLGYWPSVSPRTSDFTPWEMFLCLEDNPSARCLEFVSKPCENTIQRLLTSTRHRF
jgi:ankyrin repeat protein